MGVSEFLLGPGDFKTAGQIIEVVRGATSDGETDEDFGSATALPFFKTSKQQTWLVATNRALYCVLDDVQRSFTRRQWRMPKDKLVDAGGNVVVRIGTRPKSNYSGLLDIGDRRGWLFSRRLFDSNTIEESVADLIRSRMA